jgi:thiol-disulfide isomerase/thioredoxin
MKQICFVVFTFFCSWVFAAEASSQKFPVPLVVPIDKGVYEFEQHKGKVVLLDFWASWCGPCRQSFPWMNTLQQRFGKENLAIVAINLDAVRDDADLFLRDVPAEFLIQYDASGKSAEQMDVQGMPMSYLIDRQGRVHSSLIGFSPSRAASHEAQILSLIQDGKAPLEVTK